MGSDKNPDIVNSYPVWSSLLANVSAGEHDADSEASAFASLELALATILDQSDSDVL